jgi:hypothetical protein
LRVVVSMHMVPSYECPCRHESCEYVFVPGLDPSQDVADSE